MLDAQTDRRLLLALRTIDGHTVYPAFQFEDRKVLPGLAEVLGMFPGDNDRLLWTIASWARVPLTSLNERSVIDALRDGDAEAAIGAARATAIRWSR